MQLIVTCPSCKQRAEYSERNRWRPFCSERCRSIDLGAWASESFRVPAQDPPEPGAEVSPPSSDARH